MYAAFSFRVCCDSWLRTPAVQSPEHASCTSQVSKCVLTPWEGQVQQCSETQGWLCGQRLAIVRLSNSMQSTKGNSGQRGGGGTRREEYQGG